MTPTQWGQVCLAAYNALAAFAENRRKSRALLEAKTLAMAHWYAWHKAEIERIDRAYKDAEAKICADLLKAIEAAETTEAASKDYAEKIVSAAQTKYQELLRSGSEYSPIEMPSGVSVSYEIVPVILDRSIAPASVWSIDSELAKRQLKLGPVPGLAAQYAPKITVRKESKPCPK